MRKQAASVAALIFLLCGCASPGTTSQDATSPPDDHVKLENDYARVLFVTSPPGAKSALHDHKVNRVMIYLDPGQMTLTDTNGKVETLRFKADEVLWSPATGPHISHNLSERPVRIVEVELKPRPAPSIPPTQSALDWGKVDPRLYKIEFENDQVRVVRVHYAPHEKGIFHEHPYPLLVVSLTDGKMSVTPPDHVPVIVSYSRGDIKQGGISKHIEENLSDSPLEVLVVEFKR